MVGDFSFATGRLYLAEIDQASGSERSRFPRQALEQRDHSSIGEWRRDGFCDIEGKGEKEEGYDD